MKRVFGVIAIFLCAIVGFSLAGCGNSHDGEVKAPITSSSAEDENYEDIVRQFEDAGFTDVETEKVEDLITGWLTKDGAVEEISINGKTDYSSGSWFQPDAKVVIRYHTFPEDKDDSGSESSTSSDTGSSEDATPSTGGTDPDTSTTEPTTAPDAATTSTITVDNNADFAALLQLADEYDSSVSEFASKYAGQIVEFDGNIEYLSPHDKYKTRYDFLIGAGDFSTDSHRGSEFQFNNMNLYDLHWSGDVPDSVSAGTNLHIVAKVGTYDPNTGLFQLTPVSTTVR